MSREFFFMRFFSLSKVVLVCSLVLFESGCGQNGKHEETRELDSHWGDYRNLTSLIDAQGVTELSGLYWNASKHCLFAVSDQGKLYILQYDSTSGKFSTATEYKKLGNPEGITQVDPLSNEFYTIDEKHFEIRRFSYEEGAKSATLLHKWSLLSEAGGMMNTGNDGPEGIAFVPDAFLRRADFVKPDTEQAYSSTLGMGGLLFVAHQKKGLIWVYDVNPEKDDELSLVGKFKSSAKESCDLAFDATTGLLYILHNCDGNSLEVTDLRVKKHGGKEKFHTVAEYPVPNPRGASDNIEGFALASGLQKGKLSAWFCKDISDGEPAEEQAVCLSQFVFRPDK